MEFGEIDIYVFDQLLRGRFDRRQRVLDAGCGAGRNLPFFLRRGFDVGAVDADPSAVRSVRHLAASLHPTPVDGQQARVAAG
jgi:tellurite methyltransferase